MDPKNVVLITGGYRISPLDPNNATYLSAEIFSPNFPPCILPDLPARYMFHTQDRGLICGGYRTQDTCRQWNSTEGKFPEKPVHKFKTGRYFHVSWTPLSEKETFLIGGGDWETPEDRKTSTVVKPGELEGYAGFQTYGIFGACSIPDPETDSVVITGGNIHSPQNYVTSLYTDNVLIENYFGKLNKRRMFHGCTSYVADKKRVRKISLLITGLGKSSKKSWEISDLWGEGGRTF